MAAKLQAPEERRQLVAVTALNIARAGLLWRSQTIPMDEPFVPAIGDLRVMVEKTRPAQQLTYESWSDLPPAERVLTDVLTVAAQLRRNTLGKGWSYPKRTTARVLQGITMREQHVAAAVVSGETFTGASTVLGALLIGVRPDQEPTDQQLAMPIDPERLASLRRSKYFGPSARLRLDEFQAGHGWEGEGDALRFDSSILNRQPPEPKPDWLLHTERTGCPALFTGRLALDMAVTILPAAINVSRHIVPGEHFQVGQG